MPCKRTLVTAVDRGAERRRAKAEGPPRREHHRADKRRDPGGRLPALCGAESVKLLVGEEVPAAIPTWLLLHMGLFIMTVTPPL